MASQPTPTWHDILSATFEADDRLLLKPIPLMVVLMVQHSMSIQPWRDDRSNNVSSVNNDQWQRMASQPTLRQQHAANGVTS